MSFIVDVTGVPRLCENEKGIYSLTKAAATFDTQAIETWKAIGSRSLKALVE